jgi:hypothetical protein
LANNAGDNEVHCPDWNVNKTIREFLKTLSFNAPKNWVTNKGKNCRSRKSCQGVDDRGAPELFML